MRPVAIVSDTTGYLPRDVVEREGLHLVSLYVNFGADRTERELDMPDFEAFYDGLRSSERLPTTSQPSVGDFVAAFEPLLAAGQDVVAIHISGGLSGTCESARQAAAALDRDGKGGERIHVVDSATTAGGLGLVTLAAAHRARGGAGAEDVATHALKAREQMKIWFAVDTLEFLRRGGRVGAASSWIGSTLRIKPILSIESEITPVERVRTSARAFERLVDYARQREASGADGWCVQHIQAPDQAAQLVEECRAVFGREPAFVSEVGPVLGTHAGPGMLGIGALPSGLLQ